MRLLEVARRSANGLQLFANCSGNSLRQLLTVRLTFPKHSTLDRIMVCYQTHSKCHKTMKMLTNNGDRLANSPPTVSKHSPSPTGRKVVAGSRQ